MKTIKTYIDECKDSEQFKDISKVVLGLSILFTLLVVSHIVEHKFGHGVETPSELINVK
jgi:hypothetical protein